MVRVVRSISASAWRRISVVPGMLLIVACSVIETIPPRDLSVTRIGVLESRLRNYWADHGRLPGELSELPLIKGRDSATVDGWSRAIRYDVTGTTVTLTSLGADGTEGGTDLDRDIVVTFDVGDDRTAM
jgi:hypothetical protein